MSTNLLFETGFNFLHIMVYNGLRNNIYLVIFFSYKLRNLIAQFCSRPKLEFSDYDHVISTAFLTLCFIEAQI